MTEVNRSFHDAASRRRDDLHGHTDETLRRRLRPPVIEEAHERIDLFIGGSSGSSAAPQRGGPRALRWREGILRRGDELSSKRFQPEGRRAVERGQERIDRAVQSATKVRPSPLSVGRREQHAPHFLPS